MWEFHSQDSELRPISCLRFWSFMEFSFASLVIWEIPIVVEYSIQVEVAPLHNMIVRILYACISLYIHI